MNNKEDLRKRLVDSGLFYDNEWLKLYVDLLYDNRLQLHISRFSEGHHAFPTHCSDLLGLEHDDSKENIFEIEYKYHILAHAYLALSAKNQKVKQINCATFAWLSGGQNLEKVSSKDEEFFKYLEEIQEKYKNDLSLVGKNNPMYGYQWGDKDRERQRKVFAEYYKTHENWSKDPRVNEKRRQSLMGHSVSDISRKKLRDYNLGRIHVTNGYINKSILPEEISDWEEKGFHRGITAKKTNKKWMNNKKTEKLILVEEINDYIKLGYDFGRLKH